MADLKAGRLLTGALACAALLALGPLTGGASAAKLRVAVGTSTLTGVGTVGSAQANCPRGTVAISGGFGQTTPDLSAGKYINVFSSHRVGARAWQASGVQYGSQLSTLTAYAYCRAQKKPKQVVKSFPLLAPARYQAASLATCPGGRHPISGGFQVQQPVVGGSSVFVAQAEILNSHQWIVTGVRSSASGTSDGVVTAYAYCVKGKRPKPKTKTVTALSAISPKSTFTADTPRCSKRKTAVSGGLRAGYTQKGNDRGIPAITDFLLIGKAWRVGAFASGTIADIPVELTSIVYCG